MEANLDEANLDDGAGLAAVVVVVAAVETVSFLVATMSAFPFSLGDTSSPVPFSPVFALFFGDVVVEAIVASAFVDSSDVSAGRFLALLIVKKSVIAIFVCLESMEIGLLVRRGEERRC